MKSLTDIRKEIRPALVEIDQFRLQKLALINKARGWYLLPILMGMLCCYCLSKMQLIEAFVVFTAGLLTALFVHFKLIHTHQKAFVLSFKEQVFRALTKQLYPKASFNPENCIDQDIFEASTLFPSFNSYEGEDYFEGCTDNGCPFMFSELTVNFSGTYTTDRYGNVLNSTNSVFNGLFFVLEIPNRSYGHIQILPDTAEKSLGALGKMAQKSLGAFFQGAQMVYLEEHPEFEQEFVVYSKNSEEAKLMLTTNLVQAIYDLRYKWNIRLRMSFIGRRIYIALENPKNFFDPNIHNSILKDALLQELYDELALCFAVVEDLSEHLGTAF